MFLGNQEGGTYQPVYTDGVREGVDNDMGLWSAEIV
jgi:hypothetical protein